MNLACQDQGSPGGNSGLLALDVEFAYPPWREGENTIPVLRGVTLRIRPGEFVAIIGPNGSGKSTLAKHLNGLLRPTSGQVMVDGLDTASDEHLWEIRRRVGMVFQNPDNQLIASLVEEEIAFGPENLGFAPQELRHRIDEALTAVGMAEYRHHAPHLLSGGQKQRVAIAAVLAMRPDYLILDEATSMLDPFGRDQVLETVGKLNRGGLGVLMVTHFMEEAVQAERVVVMAGGRVMADGPARQILARIEDLERWGLSAPPMARLAFILRAAGLRLPADIFEVEEMVTALHQALRGGSHR